MIFINWIKKRYNFICFYLSSLIVLGLAKNIWSGILYESGWTVGEWLINYSGGFVRRGLIGTIIYNLSSLTQINPIIFVQIFSLISYFAYLFLLKDCKKVFSRIFLLSPLVSLFPILGDFVLRKDCLQVFLYGLCCLIIINIRRYISFFLINIISIFAIFNHESFFFFAIPSLIILITLKDKDLVKVKKINKSLFKSIALLSPSFICLIFVFYFKGSPSLAHEIHNSWQSLSGIISTERGLFSSQVTGAIGQIGWDLSNAQDLLIRATIGDKSFDGFIYIPAVWLISIFFISQIFIGDGQKNLKKLKANILLIQFASISPLLILGWDYGRWIFLWINSSIFFTSALLKIFHEDNSLRSRFETIAPKLILDKMNGISFIGKWQITYLMIFIPHCCWSLKNYISQVPLFYPFSLLIKFLYIKDKIHF